MSGSSTVACHGWSTVSLNRSCAGAVTSDVPSALSWADQIRPGWDEPPSLVFQVSQALPVEGSTKGLGSMAPPWAPSQRNGPPGAGVNCAEGLRLVAVAMAR